MHSSTVGSGRRLLRTCLGLIACLAPGSAPAQPVEWPPFGAERNMLHLRGIANDVPDLVGPIDGSAELTIFTEGNHFPVLLPLTLEAFPAWCRSTDTCRIEASKILVVTLPQAMIVDILLKGGARLGNAVLPVGRSEPVFPTFVMGGREPLARLAEAGLIERNARVFARHRGLGLLLAGTLDGVSDLKSFHDQARRVIIASETEPGARNQYRATLEALLGPAATAAILAREVRSFSGRLGIQHRDVPYAVLNGLADGGIIFSHLAAFYASRFPDRLRHVAIPAAEPFGQEIAVAATAGGQGPVARAYSQFLLEAARTVYPAQGFSAATAFEYGREIKL